MQLYFHKDHKPIGAIQINRPTDHPAIEHDPEGFKAARVKLTDGSRPGVSKEDWLLFESDDAAAPFAVVCDASFHRNYNRYAMPPDAPSAAGVDDEPIVVYGPNKTIYNPMTPLKPGDVVWVRTDRAMHIVFPAVYHDEAFGGCAEVTMGRAFVEYMDGLDLGYRPRVTFCPARRDVFATAEEARNCYRRRK